MNVLMDTHVFYWWQTEPRRLTREEYECISNPDNTIHLSYVSAWEMEIKKALGKLKLEDDWMDSIPRQSFKWLPIRREHLLALRTLPAFHRDPFDRLLVAQARSEGLRMLSHDENVMKYFRVADPVEEVRNP